MRLTCLLNYLLTYVHHLCTNENTHEINTVSCRWYENNTKTPPARQNKISMSIHKLSFISTIIFILIWYTESIIPYVHLYSAKLLTNKCHQMSGAVLRWDGTHAPQIHLLLPDSKASWKNVGLYRVPIFSVLEKRIKWTRWWRAWRGFDPQNFWARTDPSKSALFSRLGNVLKDTVAIRSCIGSAVHIVGPHTLNEQQTRTSDVTAYSLGWTKSTGSQGSKGPERL